MVGVTAGTSASHFGGYLRQAVLQSGPLPTPSTQSCGETFAPGSHTDLSLQGQRTSVLNLTT